MQELAEIRGNFLDHAHGFLNTPFKLTISRPGCEFDDAIAPSKDYYADESDGGELLRRLYDHAAPSGFGDVRAQETKFDLDVRNAREIPSSEFTVDPSLLDEVARLWAADFHPRRVRVEPYKIHVYGPQGHFKSHRDTPAAGLVGTFLIGIGDSTRHEHLEVGDVALAACAGEWTAFYPDVPHCVTTIARGYRAVLAFKVYRSDDADASAEVLGDPEIARRVQGILDKIPSPFGLLLPRKYCMGTERLSGFDALLYTCLQKRADARVDLLPIVIRHSASWPWDCDERGSDASIKAVVYPFTTVHVDYLLALRGSQVCSSRGYALKQPRSDLDSDPNLKWLQTLKGDVPFFYMDLDNSTVTWSAEKEESIEYTGNESRPHYEDSVYLSYALVTQVA